MTQRGTGLLARRRGNATGATTAAVAATLTLAVVAWAVAVWQMQGMDMGVATRIGPLPAFLAAWGPMMAAMMLPGAAPAIARRARARARTVPLFLGSYIALWTVMGVAVYAAYQPHGTVAAGVIAITAGVYEFTPLKRHFRQRCRDDTGSGLAYGACCVGSSIGLMALLVALGVMSLAWMSVITALVLAQKLLPLKSTIDVPLASAIVGLGVLIIIAPALIPGLTPPM